MCVNYVQLLAADAATDISAGGLITTDFVVGGLGMDSIADGESDYDIFAPYTAGGATTGLAAEPGGYFWDATAGATGDDSGSAISASYTAGGYDANISAADSTNDKDQTKPVEELNPSFAF